MHTGKTEAELDTAQLLTLMLRADEDDWRELALCAEVGQELFFPPERVYPREAKRICRRCEVQTECLQSALDHGDRYGVWGGLSERELRQLRKQRDQEAA